MLREAQTTLRSFNAEVRWTSIESIHLTLKFLGEINPAILPDLTQGLRRIAASHHRFLIQVRGLGAFPELRSPRVIWSGIEGEVQKLTLLQEDVERVCAESGFPLETRPFQPHLTLGRVKGKRNLQRLLDYIRIGSDFESRIEVCRVNIYRSTLRPQGAVYDVLEDIALPG